MADMEGVQHSNPPNNTIYVRNLEERVKIPELIESLQEVFGEYGTILDIVAKKSLKRKGQAFIVFEDPDSAAQAMEDIQGFELAGKPMRLEWAKTKSDAIVRREATEDDFEAHKRRRLAEKDRKRALEDQETQKAARPATQEAARAPKAGKAAGAAVIPAEYLPPNKILFVQNVPKDVKVDDLTAIFEQYQGFKEIRTVPGRKEIAFVEYDTVEQAITAKESTANMAVGKESQALKTSYQRHTPVAEPAVPATPVPQPYQPYFQFGYGYGYRFHPQIKNPMYRR